MFEKQLIEAIIAGDKNKVVRLFQLGVNVHPQNEFDPIPLNVAAIFESKDPSHRTQTLKKVMKKIDPYFDVMHSLSSYERMSSYRRDTPMYDDYECTPKRGSPSRS